MIRKPFQTVIVTGPESTGKSTLCADLAAAIGTVWRPEAAREYLETLDRPYEEKDVLQILSRQSEAEQVLCKEARNGWLVADTGPEVLLVWSEAKYGRCHSRILHALAEQAPALYLLTAPDLPWAPDPQREHPDPADRLRFWHQYRDFLIWGNVPWVPVYGDRRQRLGGALSALARFA